MALYVKHDDLKQVPWFSLAEWHGVYKQIYSNDTIKQTKGYEKLLVWKARLPKIPVGVECTLSIIQVCLRDRDLTPKIDRGELPSYYENDLCLMYSTTIMRFLNQIANIGLTKQSSLFQIAKQLRIPQWIVNIRHDAAHGHNLPSISVLRIASNILLEWLHDEYWAAEIKGMEAEALKDTEETDAEPVEAQNLTELIELWIAIGVYIHAGYIWIKDIPDMPLRETLSNLFAQLNVARKTDGSANKIDCSPSHFENYKLTIVQNNLLSEISIYFSKNKLLASKDDIVLNILLKGDAFLPSEEFLEIFNRMKPSSGTSESESLPLNLTRFWQEFVTLLHEREILEKLILGLLKLVNDEQEHDRRRVMAALWLKYIASGLCKIKVAQQIKHKIEHQRENVKKKIPSTILSLKVQQEVDTNFPELKHISWLNALGEIPAFLTDVRFVEKIISNFNNRFSIHFIAPLMDLVAPSLSDDVKEDILTLYRVFTGMDDIDGDEIESEADGVKTIDDLTALFVVQDKRNLTSNKRLGHSQTENIAEVGDQSIRNSSWTLSQETFDWSICPIGVLPWQSETIKTVNTFSCTNLSLSQVSKEFNVLPGTVDAERLTMRSKIDWNSVLVKKSEKRKRNRDNMDNMVNTAIKIVKKRF